MARLLHWLLLSIGIAVTALPMVVEAAPVLLATHYSGQRDVGNYLVSEKLDGVRAVWDGEQLRFRSGKPIAAPQWFIAALPKRALDGELWMGRGTFEAVSAATRRTQPDDAEWQKIRYMIFELPGEAGTFADRAATMTRVVAAANVPWLHEIRQFSVVDRDKLEKRLREVVQAGGEGLMLHRADAPYVAGRSDVLLKMKPWQDAEAVVVGHEAGRGKYAGMLGALRVRAPDGRIFDLGTGFSDAQRQDPPLLGTTVTYRYRGHTAAGYPRFASFLRVWEE